MNQTAGRADTQGNPVGQLKSPFKSGAKLRSDRLKRLYEKSVSSFAYTDFRIFLHSAAKRGFDAQTQGMEVHCQ